MSKFSWEQHWSLKEDGGHRYQKEEFLRKEADEKMFHLKGGNSLLDFGCGSADLLGYYAEKYNMIVGVDFSQSMLEKAAERIRHLDSADTITLVKADEKDVWDKVTQSFDRITTAGVMQYLRIDQIDEFIKHASKRINENGKIVLFDIIDPRIYYLKEYGFLESGSVNVLEVFKRLLTYPAYKIVRRLRRLPASEIGYAYYPGELEKIAHTYSLDTEIVWSMYYEYRYHAILTHNNVT